MMHDRHKLYKFQCTMTQLQCIEVLVRCQNDAKVTHNDAKVTQIDPRTKQNKKIFHILMQLQCVDQCYHDAKSMQKQPITTHKLRMSMLVGRNNHIFYTNEMLNLVCLRICNTHMMLC
jgi:hypothetical protein